MNLIISYPVPFDAWHLYRDHVKKFADTFKLFPPGIRNYTVVAVANFGWPTDEVQEWFYGIKTMWIGYHGHGCDIGAAQTAACAWCNPEDLLLCMTSRCYFHRSGWGARFLRAYENHGDALYGAFTSSQTGKRHICTRAYAMRAQTFRQYPHTIDSREKGPFFEVGEGCITDWFRQQGKPLVQVLWDNEQLEPDWNKWEGRFRNGNQQACLVHDFHTDQYRDADDIEKRRLEAMAAGMI